MIDLPTLRAGGVANAVLHQVAEDDPVGVLVEDGLVDLGLLELDGGRAASSSSSSWSRCSSVISEYLMPLRRNGVVCVIDLERHEIGRPVADGFLEAEVSGRVAALAAEDLEGVAGDEIDRRGGQPDLEAVEIGEQVAVAVVDAAVRLVGDDQVEKADVERSRSTPSSPGRWRDRSACRGPSTWPP